MTTKESIFNEALNLFAQQGYEVTTIRTIVGRVGIKESSFYNHYLSKKALQKDILRACDDFFLQENPSITERTKWAEQYSMREVFQMMMSRFIDMWEKPLALQMWQVVSSEQY